MSREIKFRFWSKILNNFVIPNDDIFIGALKDKNMIVQQYTGLLDRNGKEIYDGDIVNYMPHEGRKKYIHATFPVAWNSTQTVYGWNIKEPAAKRGFYEIVGNICENPEHAE